MLAADGLDLADDALIARQNDDQTTVISVLDNDRFDADYEGDRLITSVSYGSQGGLVEISDDGRSIVYQPPADFVGEEKFTYFVDDADFALVKVQVESPLEKDRYVIPPDGVTRTLDVMANDPFWNDYSGPRNITLISTTSQDSTVQISADGKSVEYTPPADGSGKSDHFLYIVDDIYPASVSISVPQTLDNDQFEIVQNDAQVRFNVLANDPFWPTYNRDKVITHVMDFQYGEAVISDDGKAILYTPNEDHYGWDSFRYVVDGAFEEYAHITIHRPTRDDWFEVDYNSSDQVFDLTSNDRFRTRNSQWRDVVDVITSVEPSENGSTVSISPDGHSIIYTAPEGFAGSDTINYVADGKYPSTARINVTRPVRNDYFRNIVYQDTPNTQLPILENDFLGNGYTGARQITSINTTEDTVGTIELRNNRVFYSPAEGFTGSDTFSYTVDGELDAEVGVYVQPLANYDSRHLCVNGLGDSYTYSVLGNDYFDRGYAGPGIITELSNLSEGLDAEIVNGGSAVRLNLDTGSHRSFDYTVDGKYTATATLSIDGHLSGDWYVSDQNTTSTSLRLLQNDFRSSHPHDRCQASGYRGDRRITSVSATEQGGTVTISADGKSVQYDPPADYIGRDHFTYVVDGKMQAGVTMNVIRRVRDDQYRVDVNGQEELPVLLNDLLGADYRGAGQITEVTTDSDATVTISADGKSITYSAPDGFIGEDTFGYAVDGKHKASVTVSVRDSAADQFAKYESLDEYSQYLLDDAETRYEHLFGSRYYPRRGGFWLNDSLAEFDAGAQAAPPRDHSETNVQVEGVDEGDIVEFDSDHIYSLAGQELVIMQAYPGEDINVLSRTLIDGKPEAEFLQGDRLTVISTVEEYIYPEGEEPIEPEPIEPEAIDDGPVGLFADIDCAWGWDCGWWWPRYEIEYSTIVTVLDVTDRTAPSIVQKTSMEGRFFESRGIGDYVYVVTRNEAVAPEPELIDEVDEEGNEYQRYETKEEYLARFTANSGDLVDAALPNYTSLGPDGEIVRTGLLNTPEEIYKSISTDTTSLLSVASVNINSSEPGLASAAGIYTVGGSIVYASLENFYVFENEYDRSGEDGTITRIHKFDWDATDGSIAFVSASHVPGRMINQFSADEYDGHLRIATTVSNSNSGNWTGVDENTLFVLRDDEGMLELVGSMHNLALNETLRSIRFMGDRAFAVTFRDVDPLFGLDLSDHSNPHSVGAITLPGFSTYIHFATPDRLITVGKNTPTGFSGPAQVSLFDVSTLSRPRIVDQYTFERFSTTEANVDHHAFGYFPAHGLLAVPSARGYSQRVDNDGDGFKESSEWIVENELMVLGIDTEATGRNDEGITFVSAIAHDSRVRRSGYVGEYLYSIANDSVHAMRVDDPTTIVGTVEDLTQVEVPNDPPIFFWPEIEFGLFDAASADLAGRLNVAPGAVLQVAAEPNQDGEDSVVFRVGDTHYMYQTDGDDVELVESDFAFEQVTWQNPDDTNDVNGDGELAPNDALVIINRLNDPNADQTLPVLGRHVTGENAEHYFYDTNGDGVVSPGDALRVINELNKQSIIATEPKVVDEDASPETVANLFSQIGGMIGDSNLDGRFDSTDFVLVFQAAEYEDDENNNSTWAEGDWNGDRDFTTADFVAAFQAGNYQAAARIVDTADTSDASELIDEAFGDNLFEELL